MALDLSSPIEALASVGGRNIPRLKKLGIKTVRDLLWHIPARYEDYSQMMPIGDLDAGQKVHIEGEIVKIDSRRIFPRRLTITTAIVKDDSGAIKVVWFNQPYLVNTLPEGTRVSLAGTVKLDKHGLYLASPTHEKAGEGSAQLTHTEGLVAVYPETEGITSKYLRFLIKPLLETVEIADPLPEDLLVANGLPALRDALHAIHHPHTLGEAEQAKKRLAFDDLLLFQMKALLERRKINQLKSIPIAFDQEYISSFIEQLPFPLTKDQKIAAWEILKDLEKPHPMNRLMEGDVGSGKTVVALIAAMQVAQKGSQAVFLAPTEVLANQHFETIRALAGRHNLEIALLTGSTGITTHSLGKKAEIKKRIARGDVKIVVGTHALIQKDVSFDDLALVVIDEQHRFGVRQRAALVKNQAFVPHLLSMTATPIPRTLALSIYGDLDISIIKEKPRNRQKIITKVIPPSQRSAAYEFIRSEVKAGRQVFVVCPRIEISDKPKEDPAGALAAAKTEKEYKAKQLKMAWAEAKAVKDEYERLSKEIFPDLKVGMLHGKLKPREKQAVMTRFKEGFIDILVSTSVIEVGVDVPNATIMMIENADRFGLAQLHQFRGRIGRGIYQSTCLLFATSAEKYINQRLKALVDCDDGFLLAEKDMAIRGPGEFFGSQQSGLPDLAMTALADTELIKKARAQARAILKDDVNLTHHPILKQRLAEFQSLTHFE
ncbi:MAG TPA: ATP-dependent DNA helicase RecG [Candidatus Paceibacterota bacterium]|nr:ATP-dependent DNA helicase RecG [Candidatus Paceibacterota bacterium]